MITFVVERHLPGLSGADLRVAAMRARDAADQLTREGRPIRYLRTTYRPDDGSCHCLFEADSDLTVRQVNDLAAIPYDRIAPAMLLAASALPNS